ncbi:MAG TPA: ArsC/Spx/MgsR family protein [Sphingomicrobium sp.]|jgi:arsenate reductase|nr:ArsC/Spx/MgsR family protein [Sphingomicrobium sp.]
MGIIIYHHPASRALLKQLISRAGVSPRDLLRAKDTSFEELGLSDLALSDELLIDAMMEHPVLINRPIVVTPRGVRLRRPSEQVLDLLPEQLAASTKDGGEQVVAQGASRVSR